VATRAVAGASRRPIVAQTQRRNVTAAASQPRSTAACQTAAIEASPPIGQPTTAPTTTGWTADGAVRRATVTTVGVAFPPPAEGASGRRSTLDNDGARGVVRTTCRWTSFQT
jgi:hypothetical protein